MDTNFIHPTAIVYPGVIFGKNNYVGPLCIIGAPAEHRGNWRKTNDIVVIGDNNIFTGLVTVDGGMEIQTHIGNNNLFMKHSYIAHDVVLWDDCTICAGVKIAGHCVIESKVNIGLNAAIHQRQKISEGCMIGMGAVITKKLMTEPYCKYAGNPAKYIGTNEISRRIA